MRGPAAREYIGQLIHEHSRAELLAKLQNEPLWESFVENMDSLGQQVPSTRAEMLEWALSDDYVIDVDKTWKIQQSITAAIKLVPYLAMRHWSLFTPEDDAPDFICSDSPVCVIGADGSPDRAQGFCMPGSIVTIPLGRRHALAGFFEGTLDMKLSANEVAGVNTMTMQNARWVYSADDTFVYLLLGSVMANSADLLHGATYETSPSEGD